MTKKESRAKSSDGDLQPRTPPREPSGIVEHTEASAATPDSNWPTDVSPDEDGLAWTADQDSSYWIG